MPVFVVIGAMKAGTVSLGHYLDDHPDVCLARGGVFGEPNFLIDEHNWSRGRGWYESLFDGAGGATAIGECYLWPSRYGFQLGTFLGHFDRSQVLVIATEVLRDRPREALSALFDHLAVDPSAVDLDARHHDHRSADKPVPRLHDLQWLPRRPPG